ncbi:hypothetical protein LEP1GSC036_1509 [Leptospira weilii str. 2006001853]|uniref:Uncharacterized protein n=1 Tax=Leptospira weilii str. 2006001853 TaxID=1001589 RepID=A0A828YV42_9LEPT|nr:hypothetical protein LEP1GSC036_1509 [Leptospira weilii str. 2006001853]
MIKSLPEIAKSAIVVRGAVRDAIQLTANNKPILNPRANVRPRFLAWFCLFLGSLPETIERKTILSIPRTISIRVRVKIATILSSVSSSMQMQLIFRKRRNQSIYKGI